MESFHEMLSAQGIMPMEAMAWTKENAKSVFIGMPKEISNNENRVPLSPTAVHLLIANGHQIVIEEGAGERAGFSDSDYLLAGAKVSTDLSEIWQSPLLLKLTPPTLSEIGFMKKGASIISCAATFLLNEDIIDAMNQKKILAIGMEYVEDNGGGFPFVRIMAEIAGQMILPIAHQILSNQEKGNILLGNVTGVTPISMVLLGSGHVVEQIAKSAYHAGIQLMVFDKDIYKLQRLKQTLGLPLVTQVIDSENLPSALQNAQIIVGALRSDNGITPCLVTEEMVSKLKPGTLIMDVCIDQGGCFETSELTTISHPVFRKHGVIHYCVPNIPSKVGKTSSLAISNLISSFILKSGKTGGVEEMLWQGKSFMKGVYLYKGFVTHPIVAKKFNKPIKDISLLLLSKG
ncbi:alanine dehydrogenase [Sandaracinomonas limnophila]|uniref:alanine dehydrogenase n=1 Tax=Sandaracinomonas limnophila TaxID=1862386 RepID=A0A437PN15_9BACT|nr:alanine dehydrogenase [Sandaracinomonas limnophila]RVU23464.1 alanine dehydrogenase [Sandaracinomonas limnophila]